MNRDRPLRVQQMTQGACAEHPLVDLDVSANCAFSIWQERSNANTTPVKRRRAFAGVVVTIGALVLAVASGTLPGARTGCSEHVHERLFFGLDGPEGAIDDREWEAFVETVVTPRFPAGLDDTRSDRPMAGPR